MKLVGTETESRIARQPQAQHIKSRSQSMLPALSNRAMFAKRARVADTKPQQQAVGDHSSIATRHVARAKNTHLYNVVHIQS